MTAVGAEPDHAEADFEAGLEQERIERMPLTRSLPLPSPACRAGASGILLFKARVDDGAASLVAIRSEGT